MKDLTEKQRQILLYVKKSIAERGISPTVREVGIHAGLSSSSTVHRHLNNLIEKGYLGKDGCSPRTLRVTKEGSPEADVIERIKEMDDDVSDIIFVEGQPFYIRRASLEDIREWVGKEEAASC